jgi:hypothetical protein
MKAIKILSILLLTFLNIINEGNAQAPTNGLVAYYPFNGTPNDGSGNNRNGTISGGVALTTDRLGNPNQAYAFNGSNGYINISNWSILSGNASRTMMLWFRTSLPTNAQYFLSWGTWEISKYSAIGTYLGNTTRNLGFIGWGNELSVSEQFQYYDNQWHFIAATFDGSTLSLFLDGVFIQSKTTTLNTTLSTWMRIGLNYDRDYFNGSLDEVRIYNRALTTNEIKQTYIAEAPTTSTAEVLRLGTDRFIHTTGTANTFMGRFAGNGITTGVGSTFMGAGAGLDNTSGTNNTFVGNSSGRFNTSGSYNTYLGYDAGWRSNGNFNVTIGRSAGGWATNGNNNSYIGYYAGTGTETQPNTGVSNTFLGFVSGKINSIGSYNTFLGSNTGEFNTSGNDNTFVGHAAGSKNTTGTSNSFLGLYSGLNTTTGGNNTFVGRSSGEANTIGNNNTYLGHAAGLKSTISSNNIFSGFYAGSENITGFQNAYIGANAGQFNIQGSNNTFLGFATGLKNTASENTFIGRGAGAYSTTADKNTYVGTFAGLGVEATPSTGTENTFVGWASGYEITSGGHNTALGTQAGGLNTSGSYNTNFGKLAGYYNISGSNNTFLGAGANPYGANKASLFNSSAIGSNAKVSINNAIVLGDFENPDLKVGIGLHNPKYRLDVKGVFNVVTAFNSPSIKVNGNDFMGIDKNGVFWVSNFVMKYSTVNQWADKVFDKSYKLTPIDKVEEFALKNKHLPNMPSAKEVVENGIDVQKMMSKLLEKVEELTIYIAEQDKVNKRQAKEIEELKMQLRNTKN